MKTKKVLIICPYTIPSACGIWSRVYSDAKALKNAGFEVHIFSSNIIKGTKEVSAKYEKFEGLHIHRFKVWFKLGGTSMFWFFLKKFRKINPDIVHTHGYRHPHSFQAFILSKLFKKKIFITTHGPFEKDENRSIFLKIIDVLYDKLIGWWELKGYSSVVMISKWEEKYLRKFGVKNLILIPNGINAKFIETPLMELNNESVELETKNAQHITNNVLYMGRIDPVKRLEWLIYAAETLPEYNFKFKGPVHGYDNFKSEIKNLEIIEQKYTPEEFIEELDNADLFVLPSVRESFGLVLVEAMSRGKIVISSPTKGALDIINNGENGFIVENENELIEAIEYSYKNWDKLQNLRDESIKTAKMYDERVTTKKLIGLYN